MLPGVVTRNTRWKLHVNFFFEDSVEECTVEVKDLDGPVILSSSGEDGANAGEVCNGGECVSVVSAIDLSEAVCYKSSLIFVDFAGSILLDAKDPLAANNVLASGFVDHLLCSRSLKSIQLFLHRFLPHRPV